MANYDFSTITAAQALAFNGATDMLVTPIGASLVDFTVVYDDAAGTVRITDTDSGHAVVFGSGIYGALVFGAGGQAMHIGSPGPDLETFATVNFGAAGNDTIEGGSVAYGGSGADLFDSDVRNHIDQIRDWESSDSLFMSSLKATAANYVESTAADQSAATAFANQQIAAGKAYVAVAVGPNLYVYADDADTPFFSGFPGTVSTTEIVGRGLNDISVSNFVSSAPGAVVIAPPPLPGSSGADGLVVGNMDNFHLSSFQGVEITAESSTGFALGGGLGLSLSLAGSGFTYDANQQLTGGSVSTIFITVPMPDGSAFQATLNTHGISAAPFAGWVATDATQLALSTVLSGNDTLQGVGSARGDLIHGYGGNDLLFGAGGPDSLFGGEGDDTIYAQAPPNLLTTPSTSTFIRGEDGNDVIHGGPGFDDINGNKGDDTIEGGSGGGDWLVGGQGNDSITAHAGDGLLYGNLGNDTLAGSNGADIILGGQADDSIQGGGGNDYISGDRGNDTETGGTGADTFHSFSGAGIDRVLDFNLSEGDRVLLDPGTHFTVNQVGADTVVDLGGGDQVILVGINMATLTGNWIVVG